MRIEIDISDAAAAAIDRLEQLVERLETSANLALLIELAGKPVQPVVSADFGECVSMPLVPDTGPEDGPAEAPVSDPDTAEAAEPAGDESKALEHFEPVEVADLAHMPKFRGRSNVQKAAIWGRMRRYRLSHGLGCWAPLAKLLDQTDDWVRSVYSGEIAVPLDTWRKIDRALEKLEGGQRKEETPC